MTVRAHPLIAVIGHPNEGKSSVLSTLTEDDTVVVNDYPGETTRCHYFPVEINGTVVLELVDTPGFQNPQRILEWMRANGKTDDALLRDFLATFADQEAFHHDCELMQPLVQGAALIYVVDCSRPLLPVDEAEMEILRLVNKPRMAVINFKDDDRDYLPAWTSAFRRHFNVIREFNAHHARFEERIALLETLKAIEQNWEPQINRAIEAFRQNWDYRRQQAVDAICEYLTGALQLVIEQPLAKGADPEPVKALVLDRYRSTLVSRERQLFDALRGLYHHHSFNFELPAQSILQEDLFSEVTWEVLGLTRKQLLVAAAGMGAGIGVALDAASLGMSTGLFAAAGALVGGTGAWFMGQELAKVRVHRLPLGGSRLVVGPSRNPQLPLVLLDRAVLFYREIMNHAHGNRSGVLPELASQSVVRQTDIEHQKQLLKQARLLVEGSSMERDNAREQLVLLIADLLLTD